MWTKIKGGFCLWEHIWKPANGDLLVLRILPWQCMFGFEVFPMPPPEIATQLWFHAYLGPFMFVWHRLRWIQPPENRWIHQG